MIIMISAANSDICQAMARILKSNDLYKDARLVGLVPDVPWPARYYFDEVVTVPMASHPSYGQSLVKTIAVVKPDIFIPFSEAELSWFVDHPEIMEQLNTKTIINPLDVLKIFLDKKSTADFLKSCGVSVPASYAPSALQPQNFPVIIKPRRSAGSKNMTVIRNQNQLAGLLEEGGSLDEDFIAQELIDVVDAEFTCGLWRAGNVLRYCTFRRQLQGGMTGIVKVEQHAVIDAMLENIAAALKGDFFINVQLRLRKGIPYVFEINPRFSGTLMMRHKIGFQDFIWTLDWLEKKKEPPLWQPPLGTMVFRISDECVVNKQGEIL